MYVLFGCLLVLYGSTMHPAQLCGGFWTMFFLLSVSAHLQRLKGQYFPFPIPVELNVFLSMRESIPIYTCMCIVSGAGCLQPTGTGTYTRVNLQGTFTCGTSVVLITVDDEGDEGRFT